MIIPYHGRAPKIAPDAFIAPTAVLIGNVEIGEGASVWYGAVLRGDYGRIVLGRGSNVQDNATLHAPEGGATIVHENVTIGHRAVLEGCVIEAGALIGMNAVVLHGATVGAASMIAAGSVVTENTAVPPSTLAAGVPATIKKELDGSSAQWVTGAAAKYRELAGQHREALSALNSAANNFQPARPHTMPTDKRMTLSQAISQFVPDGSSVVLGTALESVIPFAAGHELIRQRRRGLTLVGPISDVLFDQLIGAGCVRAVRAAWVGNVITGSAYNFRRAVESGSIEIEDHSNLTLALALRAGAMGVPFLPARTALGSDLFKTNANLKTLACPFTGETLVVVAAIVPDVAILHVQRADAEGNAHLWGNFGVSREAALASRHVIICAEEIVAPEVITGDPNRVVAPAFRVSAVVHAPWGAHPSPVPGYYNRDHEIYLNYQRESQTPENFAAWQARWVDGVRNSDEYLALLGPERTARLALQHHAPAAAVDYGY